MEKKIVNLTQHPASVEQKEAGVFDLQKDSGLFDALTFTAIPSKDDIETRAERIATIALINNATHAMIGGAPYLMGALETALKVRGVQPLYAFSERVSVEKEVNGEVIKTSVFKHLGFVEV